MFLYRVTVLLCTYTCISVYLIKFKQLGTQYPCFLFHFQAFISLILYYIKFLKEQLLADVVVIKFDVQLLKNDNITALYYLQGT
jgi:hypothetical protein